MPLAKTMISMGPSVSNIWTQNYNVEAKTSSKNEIQKCIKTERGDQPNRPFKKKSKMDGISLFILGTSINDVSTNFGFLDPPPSPFCPSFSPKNRLKIQFLLLPPSP